jgi:hypothetical protein
MLISDEAGRWGMFRAALRRRDREAFDNLFAVTRRHFSAIGNSGIPDPFEAVMLSFLLECEKRLEVLEGARNTLGLPACGPQAEPVAEDAVGGP